jgi:hypothetical protein
MIKLTRDEKPEEGIAFVAMPYGHKPLANGEPFHFDALYHEVYVPTIRECGMTAERADHIWGASEGVLEAVWRGIQHAEVVIVDCTTRSADVALELGLAMVLGKRSVVLAQCLEDIPTDLRGRVRPILYETAGLGVAGLMQKLKDQLHIVRGETMTENTLVPLMDAGTEPMPGSVVVVTKERAVVETDAGGHRQLWELSNADVDYARKIPDMTRRFTIGDRLPGAIVTDFEGARRYTLLVDKINPWPGLVADYPVGRTFTSQVVNLRDGVGAFVCVTGGINGRVPSVEARQAGLTRDTQVEVEIVRVDPAARQVGLRLRKVLLPGGPVPGAVPPARQSASQDDSPAASLPAVGARLLGCVTRVAPEQQGRSGYLLLRLKGYQSGPQAILHWKRMSQELREDLNDSDVELMGEEIMVEVTQVDPARRRIELRELPTADQQAAAA